MSFLGRVNYYGGWYDYDSGFARLYTTVTVGAQNAFNTYPDESARDVRRREVQRVHAMGLQRRLLLRATRVRMGQLVSMWSAKKKIAY